MGDLANGQKQIAIPVAADVLTPIYVAAGLESRLDSLMFVTMSTGQGSLDDVNGWLGAECNGLQLVAQ